MKLTVSLVHQFKDKIVNFFRWTQSSSSSDVEINIPTINSMVMQSFQFYLETYRATLLGHNMQRNDFVQCFNRINMLFKQHCNANIKSWGVLRQEPIHGIEKV